jgi:pre-60S factor REI1
VTKEWFEQKRAQLGVSGSGSNTTTVWIDTLSKKKFYSENTYLAYTRSKKYQELVKKKCGGVAPEPVVKVYKQEQEGDREREREREANGQGGGHIAGQSRAQFEVKKLKQGRMIYGEDGEGAAADSEEEWETASEESSDSEGEDPDTWEKWDLCRSLFDNHMSATMEDNLEYMWKTYGFYLPDAKYLKDPEGLLQYLGAKMQYGKLPLYESGLNPEAKRLKSLHGVQRHMVDRGKCKILYDGNEDEYEDYYDYSLGDGMDVDGSGEMGAYSQEEMRNAIIALNAENVPGWFQAAAGYELAIPNPNGKGVKILGTREFARYYKQRHYRPKERAYGAPTNSAALVVRNRYSQLTVPVFGDGTVEGMRKAEQKRALKCKQRVERVRLMASLRRNVNDNLPKNVPY